MNITFDIGGTNLRAGLFSDDHTLVKKIIKPTPVRYVEGLSLMVGLVEDLRRESEEIHGIAVASCGVLDRKVGKVLINPNLPGWNGALICSDLSLATNTRVVLENDAGAAGLGEAHFGAGKGIHIVAFLTIGTGIGGTRIVNGAIDANTWGFEPGHQIINVDTMDEAVDGFISGWLESYASGAAFEKRYGISAKTCTDASIWKDFAKHLAAGVVNVIVLWSPDIVILGGGVLKSAEKFMPFVRDYVNRALIFPKKPSITVGSLGDEAGLYGGLTLL